MVTVGGRRVDPATVKAVRTGNALWPGMSLFTGLSFLVYLLVKLASGAVAFSAGLAAQLAVSALLLAVGGWAMARARYFFVVVETAEGGVKIGGLTRRERDEAAAALGRS